MTKGKLKMTDDMNSDSNSTPYMRVQQQDKEINNLLTLINSKNREINRLNDIIREQNQTIYELSQSICNNEQQINNLEKSLKRERLLSNKIPDLEKALEEKDEKIDALSEIYFDEWYKNNEGRLHCGQMNEREIAKDVFLSVLRLEVLKWNTL